MQIFIDSADPEEIRKAWEMGIIDGVTTNPSLAAKVGKSYKEIITEILSIVDEDTTVSLEVVATDYEGMLEQGRKLAAIDDRVVVKIPCTLDGIRATRKLTEEGILVNVTLVFSPAQALLAAKAGAFFISPFVGRINDVEDGAGFDAVKRIIDTVFNYDYHSQILYASVRNTDYVEHAAAIGADVATVPFGVLMKMVEHPLTSTGLQKFVEDWDKSGLELPV